MEEKKIRPQDKWIRNDNPDKGTEVDEKMATIEMHHNIRLEMITPIRGRKLLSYIRSPFFNID